MLGRSDKLRFLRSILMPWSLSSVFHSTCFSTPSIFTVVFFVVWGCLSFKVEPTGHSDVITYTDLPFDVYLKVEKGKYDHSQGKYSFKGNRP